MRSPMEGESPWRQPYGTWEFWRSRWPRFLARFALQGFASAGLCALALSAMGAGWTWWPLSALPVGVALLAGALAPLTAANWENALSPADSEVFRRKSVAVLNWWGAILIWCWPVMLAAVLLFGPRSTSGARMLE